VSGGPAAGPTDRVGEPFASDPAFWSSLAASADAAISLAVAVVAGVALALAGFGWWAVTPFVLTAGFVARAALISRRVSRANRMHFADRVAWRNAERRAVAGGFGIALRGRLSASRRSAG
jgi:hypothetical protein